LGFTIRIEQRSANNARAVCDDQARHVAVRKSFVNLRLKPAPDAFECVGPADVEREGAEDYMADDLFLFARGGAKMIARVEGGILSWRQLGQVPSKTCPANQLHNMEAYSDELR